MDKRAITEEVLKQVKSKYDIDSALKAWWWRDYAGHQQGRLTKAGHNAVSKVMRPFTFNATIANTGATIKRLSQLQTPYYVDHKEQTITIYSKPLATMIRMYPSFDRYLELIQ